MARPRLVSNDQILTTMRENVLTHGPNVSLDVVAAQLRVSVPALLKRFKTRQALLLAALKPPENPDWIASLKKGPSLDSLREQLFQLFSRVSDFMAEVIPCVTALRESGIPFQQLSPKPCFPQGIKALQQWLRKARECGLITVSETDAAAFAMLGALQTKVFFAHVLQQPFSKASQRKYLEELTHLFTRALTLKSNGDKFSKSFLTH